MLKFILVLMFFFFYACDSEFDSNGKFAVGSSDQKKSGDQNPILVGNERTANNTENGSFQSGDDFYQQANARDLLSGEGQRDCITEAAEDPTAETTVDGHGNINNIVNSKCLSGLPGGSAVFNGPEEKQLLCNLLGYLEVVSVGSRGWSSPGDNYTWTFEQSGTDETTNLPKGKLQSNPARSIPNNWISRITCRGKLHSQCEYIKNEQGKIDCTGL